MGPRRHLPPRPACLPPPAGSWAGRCFGRVLAARVVDPPGHGVAFVQWVRHLDAADDAVLTRTADRRIGLTSVLMQTSPLGQTDCQNPSVAARSNGAPFVPRSWGRSSGLNTQRAGGFGRGGSFFGGGCRVGCAAVGTCRGTVVPGRVGCGARVDGVPPLRSAVAVGLDASSVVDVATDSRSVGCAPRGGSGAGGRPHATTAARHVPAMSKRTTLFIDITSYPTEAVDVGGDTCC
jgi:hypothetical protein